jgi:hypothetical protein
MSDTWRDNFILWTLWVGHFEGFRSFARNFPRRPNSSRDSEHSRRHSIPGLIVTKPEGGLRRVVALPKKNKFAADSLLEGNGFEPSVPREIGLRSGSVNRRQTGRRRSDHGDTAMAVGAVDESCRLNRGNLNILSEARIHAPELIGYQVSVDPI